MRYVPAVLALACSTTAFADWPTQPDTPLPIGPADTLTDIGHVVTPDGATWVAWLDTLCLPVLLVQRIDANGNELAPGGMVVDDDPQLCGNMDLFIEALPDSSIIIQAGATNTGIPMHRIGPDGTRIWDGLLIDQWIGGTGAVHGLPGGDVLIGGNAGQSQFIMRVGLDGTALWTSEIPTATTSNRRTLAVIPDDEGGVFAIYDMPLSYTRRIDAVHVDSSGVPTWTEPLNVVPPDPSSSRHTDPVAVSDGEGGVVVVFTEGSEQASTPMPLLMQRFDNDGTLAFAPEGVRVSLDSERQFDAIVTRDDATDELLIAWRSGGFDDQQLRAQRMTTAGARLWGDTGITIAEMGVNGGAWFEAVWDGTELTGIVSRPLERTPSVLAYRVSAGGGVDPGPIVLSGETESMSIAGGGSAEAVTVSWFELDSGFSGDLVAQRLNADGTLGGVLGDLDGNGLVDVADVIILLGEWGPCAGACVADLDGDGMVGANDLLMMLANWG